MENNGRFVRWQTILRNQLSFINSLLLTISLGVIGFIVSLLNNPLFNPKCSQKVFLTFGLIIVFVSIIIGLFMAFIRLVNFRTTLKKIKNETGESKTNDNEKVKNSMTLYDKITWVLFYLQTLTFGIGIISLMIAFCILFKNKLF